MFKASSLLIVCRIHSGLNGRSVFYVVFGVSLPRSEILKILRTEFILL